MHLTKQTNNPKTNKQTKTEKKNRKTTTNPKKKTCLSRFFLMEKGEVELSVHCTIVAAQYFFGRNVTIKCFLILKYYKISKKNE